MIDTVNKQEKTPPIETVRKVATNETEASYTWIYP